MSRVEPRNDQRENIRKCDIIIQAQGQVRHEMRTLMVMPLTKDETWKLKWETHQREKD